MPIADRPLFAAPIVRVVYQRCPCEHSCGGYSIHVTDADDARFLAVAGGVAYEHLSWGEAADVVDAHCVPLHDE